jgi:hypothetical protein
LVDALSRPRPVPVGSNRGNSATMRCTGSEGNPPFTPKDLLRTVQKRDTAGFESIRKT